AAVADRGRDRARGAAEREAGVGDRAGVHRPGEGRGRRGGDRDAGGVVGGRVAGHRGGGVDGREPPADGGGERDAVGGLDRRGQGGGVGGVVAQRIACTTLFGSAAVADRGRDRARGAAEREAGARDRAGVHRPGEGRRRGDVDGDAGG